MNTPFKTAQHELAHCWAGCLVLHKSYPELLGRFTAEVHVAKDGGGHCVFVPVEGHYDHLPEPAMRAVAMGPAVLNGLNHLRQTLRNKTLSLEGADGLSGADTGMLMKHGGEVLSLQDCELLTALAQIVFDARFEAAAHAVKDAGTLVLPVVDWLPRAAVLKALSSAGRDFMQLHSRHPQELPVWAVKSVERRFERVMAFSSSL